MCSSIIKKAPVLINAGDLIYLKDVQDNLQEVTALSKIEISKLYFKLLWSIRKYDWPRSNNNKKMRST